MIDARLHSATSKCSDDVLGWKRWNRQVIVHLLQQSGNRGGVVDHVHASLRFAVAACQHARTHSRSTTERTRSGTAPSTTVCGISQPASPLYKMAWLESRS